MPSAAGLPGETWPKFGLPGETCPELGYLAIFSDARGCTCYQGVMLSTIDAEFVETRSGGLYLLPTESHGLREMRIRSLYSTSTVPSTGPFHSKDDFSSPAKARGMQRREHRSARVLATHLMLNYVHLNS